MSKRAQNYIAQAGLDAFKHLVYSHTTKHTYSCVLDSCQLNTGVHSGSYDLLAAYGASRVFDSYAELCEYMEVHSDWCFGIMGYDLKAEFESLESNNARGINTPALFFFVPEVVLSIDKRGVAKMLKGNLSDDFWKEVLVSDSFKINEALSPVDEQKYLQKINEIHELIRAGDVYELNYCVPFSHSYDVFSPVSFQEKLLKKSPVPMGAYLRRENLHLCGASMERFLAKNKTKLISQPIKGTIGKGRSTKEDVEMIRQLQNSEKDRAENVMIVDLVRNDLARVSVPGTVEVSELFGIYSYLQVHQMISTVQSVVRSDIGFSEIMKATFPMGSMTGTPKIAAMKHIEQLEDFRRGWYSGALGYVSPDGDFDFNVVIRSVLCDTTVKKISYAAGGAITIDSDPANEWHEVHLKTKAITEVLSSGID